MRLGAELFLIFLILKLCHLIAWSWWWITLPLWIGFLINAILFWVLGIVTYIEEMRK